MIEVLVLEERWQRSAKLRINSGVRPGIRYPVSCGYSRYHERTTDIPSLQHCELLDGSRHSSSKPGCAVRSRGIRDTMSDYIRGGEKSFCGVTTCRVNFWVLNGLGRDFASLPALSLGLSMIHFDLGVLKTFSLTASRLPAADLPQAFRGLVVALVPASWLILTFAFFAQADPWSKSLDSAQTAVSLRNVECTQGSCDSQGKARGEWGLHSPRALLKFEQHA
jgi:hypothetical protein